MKRKIFIITTITLAIAALTLYFTRRPGAGAATVSTAQAGYGYISKSITATGTVEPVDTVSVGAQISGLVVNVFADFNTVVKKGQLLAEVDPTIMTAQLQEARSTLTTAQSNLQYQKNTFDRQNQLYTLGAISKADYQLALNEYNSAKAAVSNATGQVSVAQRNLAYTQIISPIDGTVLNRNVSVGQTIAASLNAPVLFVIAKDLTKMQVNAAVDEADIGHVSTGQNVTFTVDAYPDSLFRGNVQQIYLHPSTSANVVTYTTLINVDNRSGRLKPGMTASINIYEQEDSSAILIPSLALNFKPDSSALSGKYKLIYVHNRQYKPGGNDSTQPAAHADHVWIVKADTLMQKSIVTGINDDSHVSVLKGIAAGDWVVTGINNSKNKKGETVSQQSPFIPKMPQRSGGGGTKRQ